MDVLFQNVRELVALAEKENKLISEIMIEQEMQMSGRTREAIMAQMDRNLTVMEEAVERGSKRCAIGYRFNRWRCSVNSKLYCER